MKNVYIIFKKPCAPAAGKISRVDLLDYWGHWNVGLLRPSECWVSDRPHDMLDYWGHRNIGLLRLVLGNTFIFLKTKKNRSSLTGNVASRSLIRVRKQRIRYSVLTPLGGNSGDDSGGGRILWPSPAPIPSRPGIKYRGRLPLTPIYLFYCILASCLAEW